MGEIDIFEDLKIIEIRFREILQCPSLEIRLSREWGAEHSTHRQDIRQGILNSFPTVVNSHDILNLGQAPIMTPATAGLPHPRFSVSHTTGLGGFAASLQGSIGFDIEVVARVTSQIAQRVAIGKELELAPNPAVLWVAKEAIFKGLRPFLQPTTLSQIETICWKKVDPLFNTFELHHPKKYGISAGKGCSFCNGLYAIGIFTEIQN
ncbi:MAG: hypothetical protein JNM39_16895 [Bdellovibrionaceae bacterium]|nr:hypothetical protein [Pseudobdellovibrionaceae bacterium]